MGYLSSSEIPAPPSNVMSLSDCFQERRLADSMSLIKDGLFSLKELSLHVSSVSLLAYVSLSDDDSLDGKV